MVLKPSDNSIEMIDESENSFTITIPTKPTATGPVLNIRVSSYFCDYGESAFEIVLESELPTALNSPELHCVNNEDYIALDDIINGGHHDSTEGDLYQFQYQPGRKMNEWDYRQASTDMDAPQMSKQNIYHKKQLSSPKQLSQFHVQHEPHQSENREWECNKSDCCIAQNDKDSQNLREAIVDPNPLLKTRNKERDEWERLFTRLMGKFVLKKDDRGQYYYTYSIKNEVDQSESSKDKDDSVIGLDDSLVNHSRLVNRCMLDNRSILNNRQADTQIWESQKICSASNKICSAEKERRTLQESVPADSKLLGMPARKTESDEWEELFTRLMGKFVQKKDSNGQYYYTYSMKDKADESKTSGEQDDSMIRLDDSLVNKDQIKGLLLKLQEQYKDGDKYLRSPFILDDSLRKSFTESTTLSGDQLLELQDENKLNLTPETPERKFYGSEGIVAGSARFN